MRGKPDALLVWFNMIAHAPDGICDRTQQTIADETGLTLDRVTDAIAYLESPDKKSRSPEEEGRRIVRLDKHRDWGWRLVNHWKYHDKQLASTDRHRIKNRERQRRFMERRKEAALKSNVSDVSHVIPASASASVQEGECEGKGQRFKEPTVEEVKLLFAKAGGPESLAEKFFHHYASNGWKVGKNKMKSVSHTVAKWMIDCREQQPKNTNPQNYFAYEPKPAKPNAPSEQR